MRFLARAILEKRFKPASLKRARRAKATRQICTRRSARPSERASLQSMQWLRPPPGCVAPRKKTQILAAHLQTRPCFGAINSLPVEKLRAWRQEQKLFGGGACWPLGATQSLTFRSPKPFLWPGTFSLKEPRRNSLLSFFSCGGGCVWGGDERNYFRLALFGRKTGYIFEMKNPEKAKLQIM